MSKLYTLTFLAADGHSLCSGVVSCNSDASAVLSATRRLDGVRGCESIHLERDGFSQMIRPHTTRKAVSGENIFSAGSGLALQPPSRSQPNGG